MGDLRVSKGVSEGVPEKVPNAQYKSANIISIWQASPLLHLF